MSLTSIKPEYEFRINWQNSRPTPFPSMDMVYLCGVYLLPFPPDDEFGGVKAMRKTTVWLRTSQHSPGSRGFCFFLYLKPTCEVGKCSCKAVECTHSLSVPLWVHKIFQKKKKKKEPIKEIKGISSIYEVEWLFTWFQIHLFLLFSLLFTC